MITNTTSTYRNDLEHAYLLGYRHAEQRRVPNLRVWPAIKRSTVLTVCYQQGFEAGLEAQPLRRSGWRAAA